MPQIHNSRRNKGRFTRRLATVSVAAAISSAAVTARLTRAASIDTWVGSSASTDWATSGNWNYSSGSGPVASGDALVFTLANNSTSTTLTDTLTGTSFGIAGITFNSGALAYTMTGNAFVLTGSIANNGTSLETIDNAISMTAIETMATASGGGNITLAGNITGTGGGILLTGAGILTLAASNSYTGSTSFGASGGTLILANTSSLGTGQLFFGAFTGTTLDVATNGNDTTFVSNASTGFSTTIVSDRATAGAGINHALGAAAYGGGSVTFSAGSNVTSGSASISFSSLTLTSGNTNPTLASLTLNPTTASVSIGPVTTSSQPKTLILDGTSTGNIITGGISQGTGAALSITKSNTSTWSLTANNSYSGITNINGGILQISASNNLGNAASTNTIGFNGGTLESTSGTYDLGSTRTVTLNGAGTIQSDSGTLTLSGAVTNGSNLLTVAGAGNTTISGAIGSGSGGVTKTGSGTLVLSNSNAYSGATNINNGILQISASDNLGNAASSNTIGFNGGTLESTSGTYDLGSTRTVTLNGPGTLQSDSGTLTVSGAITNGSNLLTVTGSGNATISGGIGSGNGGITKTGTGTLTLSASDSFSGATSFGGNNGGTILFGNAASAGTGQFYFNAYTGNTLDIATNGSDTAFATNSNTGFNATILSDRATAGAGINHALGAATYGGGTLNIASGSNVTSGTASISFASLNLSSGNPNPSLASVTLVPTTANLSIGTVTTSSGEPKTLFLDGTSSGNAITGAISEGASAALSLTKSNTGAWTLSGSNSYSGSTTISGGTLRINGMSTGAGAVTVASGATFGGSGTIGLSSTPNGAITVNSGGTIVAGSSSTASGKLTSLSTSGVTLAGGSGYTWKINNGTGAAGTTSGWDELVTQGVTFNALNSSSTFTVYINGTPTNLLPGTKDYIIATTPSFSLASSSSGNGTISANTILVGSGASSTYSSEFALDTTGFSASASPVVGSSSSFQLEVVSDASSGYDLDIVYSATPEPGTAMLLLAGGLAPMLIRRRRYPRTVSQKLAAVVLVENREVAG